VAFVTTLLAILGFAVALLVLSALINRSRRRRAAADQPDDK
jgi:hypothetical protein